MVVPFGKFRCRRLEAYRTRRATQFRDSKSYTLQIQIISISVAGSTAMARCWVTRSVDGRSMGKQSIPPADQTFDFQKEGNTWVITKLSSAAASR